MGDDVVALSDPHRIDSNGDLWLVRVRIGLIAVGFAIVGVAAGGIFDRYDWTMVVAPLLPAAVAAIVVGRSSATRAGGAIASVLLATAVTVVVAGGTPGDVVRAFTSGLQGLLSTDWPSPPRADLLGTIAAALASACAVSAEVTSRRRFHLLGLLPLVLASLGVVALSAPLGVTWWSLVGIGTVSIAFALLRNDGSLADRLVLLRGERRLVPLIASATMLASLAAIALSLGVRADPRRNDPAQQTAPLLDPIEATLALQNLDPPIELHVVTSNDDSPLPVRWRTAALSSYDGRRWSPNLTLRPIGSTLGPATGPTIDADVSFLDDNLTLVPLPGSPVEVAASVETDGDRTVVRLADRPSPGDVVGVVANAPDTPSEATAIGVAPRLVDESTSGLTQLAEGLAGGGSDLERLSRLETTMREDFVLDSDVAGGGLEQALIDRFLRDTQRGTREQFATSFVLLARSLGIEARVATGFVADGDDGITLAPAGDPVVLASGDAEVWPEVQLVDGSWIAYEPVPAEEAAGGAPPPPEPQVQTPAAPQPPIAPPPESDNESATPDDETAPASDRALSAVLGWALRGSLAVAIVALPFLLAAALIAGLKYRRRKRRLRTPDPVGRIRGAWASATDALVDAGLDIVASASDSEISGHGAPFVPDASPELRRLATMSSAATFGSPRHPDLIAQEAVSCLGSVERAVIADKTRWQRLRWRLSLRSLRPATRSPVSV